LLFLLRCYYRKVTCPRFFSLLFKCPHGCLSWTGLPTGFPPPLAPLIAAGIFDEYPSFARLMVHSFSIGLLFQDRPSKFSSSRQIRLWAVTLGPRCLFGSPGFFSFLVLLSKLNLSQDIQVSRRKVLWLTSLRSVNSTFPSPLFPPFDGNARFCCVFELARSNPFD